MNQLHTSKLLLLICTIFFTGFLYSQSLEDRLSKIDQNNFYEIQSVIESYLSNNDDPRLAKHWGRYKWQMEGRVYPSGNIQQANETSIRSYLNFQRKQINTRATHGGWGFYGPTSTYDDQYGRCLRMKADPNDPNILYVVAAGSGLWRSTDQGNTWKDLTPNLPNQYLADVAVDYNNPDTIYILTGDGEAAFYMGRDTYGILKSYDGGKTWLPTSFMPNSVSAALPHKLIMHPSEPNIMLAALSNRIIRTEDGWDSWEPVKSGENFTDIEWFQGGGTIAYAVSNQNLYMSLDTGKVWTLVTDSDFSFIQGKVARRSIATATTDFNKMYMVAANDTMTWLYRSESAGINDSWVLQDSLTNTIGGQSTYNNCITISPFNSDIVFVGGIGLWRSLTRGTPGSWVDKYGIHADHHDILFAGGILYDLNDGGIAKSFDGGETWYNITPGILVSENYRIDGTAMNTSLYLCGNQDVGGFKVTSGTFNNDNLSWGDIMEVLIDYSNTDNMFASPQQGGLRSSIDGGLTWKEPVWEPEVGNGEWICPYYMDTKDPKLIYTGKDSIYRLDYSTSTSILLGDAINGKTREIRQGFENRNRLYAITGNQLFRTDDALGTGIAAWTDISTGLPTSEARLGKIEVNPNNHKEIYVAFESYSDGNKIFFSNEAGAVGSWQNISGSLPNVPIWSLAFHFNEPTDHKLYVGSDLGVFYKDDSLTDWIYYSNGMPSVPITDLFINTGDNTIMASTWGRGMWQSSLYSSCPLNILLTGSAPNAGTMYYSANNSIYSINQYEISLGTNIHYQSNNFIDMELGFEIMSPANFEADIGPCPDFSNQDFRISKRNTIRPKSQLILSAEQWEAFLDKKYDEGDIKK